MFARYRTVIAVALSSVLAGAPSPGAASTPVPPTAAPEATTAPVPTGLRGKAAPVAFDALGERFAQPDQTIEYHFMIRVAALSEADLGSAYQAGVVEPLKAVADVGALGRCKAGIYVDSKGRGLQQHNVIVRVRDGRITIKARAASPSALLDLASCASRKYEMDYFGTPDYSISSEFGFGADELDIRPPALTPARLWDLIGRKCPGVWQQLRPVVRSSGTVEIPGVAHTYGAAATLKHPAAAKVKEAGVAVWFFPPTDRFLVELSFTGFVKDRADMDRMYAELGAALRSAGLLRAEQSSKTEQYFDAYFGPGNTPDSRPLEGSADTVRPGTQRTRKPR